MTPTIISRVAVRLLTPTIWAVAALLLWQGHNAPGGGFIGALVAGSALALADLVGCRPDPTRAHGATLAAVGLAAGLATATAPLAFGRPFLDAVPVDIAGLHLTTALPFDIGVALIVLGLVRTLLSDLAQTRPGDGIGDVP